MSIFCMENRLQKIIYEDSMKLSAFNDKNSAAKSKMLKNQYNKMMGRRRNMSVVDMWGKKHHQRTLKTTLLNKSMEELRKFKIANSGVMVQKELDAYDLKHYLFKDDPNANKEGEVEESEEDEAFKGEFFHDFEKQYM